MLRLLFIAIAISASPNVGLFAQSKETSFEELKWHASVSESTAVFTFPKSMKRQWSWDNADTAADELEYSWMVTITDSDSSHEFGAALFRFDDKPSTIGSLSDLIDSCQHDLWKLSKDGGSRIGGYGKARVSDGKVHLTISDLQVLETLFDTKPAEVWMAIRTPEMYIRKKVALTYKK